MKKKVIELAKEFGCMVQQGEVDKMIDIDAPVGYVFKETSTHVLVCHDWQDAAERLANGIEECKEHDCEVCQEAATFDSIHEMERSYKKLIYKP